MPQLINRPDAAHEPMPLVSDRILIVDPDRARARRVTRLLRSHLPAQVQAVGSTDEAIRSLSEALPDLVLTSTLLAPSEDARLHECLRRTPGASHVQIINVPHFIDEEPASGEAAERKVFSLRSWRAQAIRPRCAPGSLLADIRTYLEQSRDRRIARSLALDGAPIRVTMQPVLQPATAFEQQLVARGMDEDRRRARRRPISEVPSLWMIRLPWGSEARVIDISTSGVLLESSSKLSSGATFDLQVLGEGTSLLVPARTVRSEVASVDPRGVRYRMAAAFGRELTIPGLSAQYPTAALTPRVLGDLLTRVMAEVDRFATPSAIRERFEAELRELLPLREVKILKQPMRSAEGEVVYFAVPHPAGSRAILQATFDAAYRPSDLEFRLLKAAASLASAVLEFAPLDAEPEELLPA
ncbi:MAG TPA: hypothetical protein VD833_25690 [Vicinamibacterales bacterium]|nr:hypothetical protein [Vicinamibacterales bacterium]